MLLRCNWIALTDKPIGCSWSLIEGQCGKSPVAEVLVKLIYYLSKHSNDTDENFYVLQLGSLTLFLTLRGMCLVLNYKISWLVRCLANHFRANITWLFPVIFSFPVFRLQASVAWRQ